MRIDGDDLGSASQVAQSIVDDAEIDGADCAQVLSHDEVGVQLGKGVLVEMVEILPASERCGDVSVDLGRRQPGWQCGVRHHGSGTRLGGIVALERHPDDIIACADGPQDLRRRRQ